MHTFFINTVEDFDFTKFKFIFYEVEEKRHFSKIDCDVDALPKLAELIIERILKDYYINDEFNLIVYFNDEHKTNADNKNTSVFILFFLETMVLDKLQLSGYKPKKVGIIYEQSRDPQGRQYTFLGEIRENSIAAGSETDWTHSSVDFCEMVAKVKKAFQDDLSALPFNESLVKTEFDAILSSTEKDVLKNLELANPAKLVNVEKQQVEELFVESFLTRLTTESLWRTCQFIYINKNSENYHNNNRRHFLVAVTVLKAVYDGMLAENLQMVDFNIVNDLLTSYHEKLNEESIRLKDITTIIKKFSASDSYDYRAENKFLALEDINFSVLRKSIQSKKESIKFSNDVLEKLEKLDQRQNEWIREAFKPDDIKKIRGFNKNGFNDDQVLSVKYFEAHEDLDNYLQEKLTEKSANDIDLSNQKWEFVNKKDFLGTINNFKAELKMLGETSNSKNKRLLVIGIAAFIISLVLPYIIIMSEGLFSGQGIIPLFIQILVLLGLLTGIYFSLKYFKIKFHLRKIRNKYLNELEQQNNAYEKNSIEFLRRMNIFIPKSIDLKKYCNYLSREIENNSEQTLKKTYHLIKLKQHMEESEKLRRRLDLSASQLAEHDDMFKYSETININENIYDNDSVYSLLNKDRLAKILRQEDHR